ncbi:MAG: ABC transporter permease [Verrucomicrobia bacterium]|nr:ABC transporter permease [Verrucomicrobiota bacterium]MBI3869762.1 ABC transporter permease [Verrucomicrobiota bacterium]
MSKPSPIRSGSRAGSLLWPAIGLVALLAGNLVFSPGFFHLEIRDGHVYGTLIDILNQGTRVMLLSLGMTLVIATGGVDLSVGSVMAVAGAVAASMVVRGSAPFGVVIAASLAVSALAGLLNGCLVVYARIQPIVATLILMVAGRGAAMLVADGQILTFEHPGFVFLGNGHFLGMPFTLTLAALALGATAWATRRTALGLFLESIGDNERAARFCGVETSRVKLFVYAFSGVCAGLAGLVAASNIKAADSSRAGEMLELDAILAVVVGGTTLTGGRFSLIGSMLGALIIQTLTTTLYNWGLPPAVAPVPKAIVILSVCLMQSPQFRERLSFARPQPKGSA